MLYSARDVNTARYFIENPDENSEISDQMRIKIMEKDFERLKMMTFYCTTSECLRAFILEYFGENPPLNWDNCGNCNTNFETTDITVDAQKIVSCVYRIRKKGRSCGKTLLAEVLYGTFFADRTDSEGGVCATIYQAQQNYPKAVKADKDGLYVMLVPEGFNDVIMQPGMAREQRFMLHFHAAAESLAELDNRSLIYQMPDRPVIAPDVYKNSGAVTDVFADKCSSEIDMLLIGKADARARSFGMLNWGDTIDQNYTKQGRGGGAAVWANNENDFPHACALMYMRMGIRRYLDFCMVHASHWMDVDVCHYSSDPLKLGGLTEHTKGHVINGVMVPSHEWVEGFLDYYHLTGDERGLETTVGIGDNIIRLLDTPAYAVAGESNARETGWALRALTALYIETVEEKYRIKCDKIVG